MSESRYNILFVCTGNSVRSIMAEALMNELGKAKGFCAFSAGSHPRGEVNPWTLKTLADNHLPTQGFRSKNWEEFAGPDAPKLHFVFTVCDQAAGETCPLWPGQPMTAHWGVPDPAAVQGSDAVIGKAFLDAFIVLRRRIQLFVSLPLDSLNFLMIQTEIRGIGTK